VGFHRWIFRAQIAVSVVPEENVVNEERQFIYFAGDVGVWMLCINQQ
jgi:hypothetical protein